MTDIRAEVHGLKAAIDKFSAIEDRVDNAGRVIVSKAAVTVASNARRQFLGAPVKEPKANNKRLAKAGLPLSNGKSLSWPKPTNRTGDLQRSIEMRSLDHVGYAQWTATVGPDMDLGYARRVEFGGVSQHSMAWGRPTSKSWTVRTRAFPYMSTGLEQSRPELRRIYENEWRKAVNF